MNKTEREKFEQWFYRSKNVRRLVQRLPMTDEKAGPLNEWMKFMLEKDGRGYFFHLTQTLWGCWQDAQKVDTESK